MKKEMKYVIVVLVLLLIGVGIGYAIISTTLKITGKTTIGKSTWDVHFENLVTTEGSVNATQPAVIDTGKTNITYEIPLAIPGDFYEFTVDVANGGSIPAKVSATPTLGGITTEEDVYINYTVAYANGDEITVNDALEPGAKVTYKVRVEFDRDITSSQLPSESKSLDLTFAVNYIQK